VSRKNLNFFSIQLCKVKDFGTKNISIIVYVLIVFLSKDNVVNRLSTVLGITVASFRSTNIFVVISSIVIICQLFILKFVNRMSFTIWTKNNHIRVIHRIVTISQYGLV
jgi:hypothetical protein